VKESGIRVLEPSLVVYLHLTRRADLGFGIGLRRVSGGVLPGVPAKSLDGRVATVALRGHF
jgi:hypothetical protein